MPPPRRARRVVKKMCMENVFMPFIKGQARRALRLSGVLLTVLSVPVMSYAEDWNYHVRPTDNIWDIAERYMKPDIPWQRLQDYNKVSAPLHLSPGSVLHVPIQWLKLKPAEATIVAAQGVSTAIVSGDADAHPVAIGMKVGFGTRLKTGPGA